MRRRNGPPSSHARNYDLSVYEPHHEADQVAYPNAIQAIVYIAGLLGHVAFRVENLSYFWSFAMRSQRLPHSWCVSQLLPLVVALSLHPIAWNLKPGSQGLLLTQELVLLNIDHHSYTVHSFNFRPTHVSQTANANRF